VAEVADAVGELEAVDGRRVEGSNGFLIIKLWWPLEGFFSAFSFVTYSGGF